ncbi:tetraspanin-9 [Brachionus plicatilis]|uniref:Tetraspanin-9 n=1 Tax=Brachionus plicatilis TaxID=10195 RepID=A0A3M7RJ27_BRAPC|nr:tetraspanin-9 [Brachionus plicatilis]
MRKMSRQSDERYIDDTQVNKSIKITSYLITVNNLLLFGIGLMLFIVGILYLTIYRYRYSFTIFSIDLLAAVFLSVGCVLCALAISGIFMLKPLGRPVFSILYAVLVFFFFLFIFILGVIGLSMKNNDQLMTQTRENMMKTAKKFDESNMNGHQTRKINWVHRRFSCCGIDSYNDWKSLISFQGVNGPVKYFGKYENKYPYMDDVPDSCCIDAKKNCGKNINVFGRDRSLILNTKGCFSLYYKSFSKDVTFLCALAIAVSVVLLILVIQLFGIFTLTNRNATLAVQNFEQNERKTFLR